jgi:hypothetical protein
MGVLKMLKKILILALLLNTPHIRPSDSTTGVVEEAFTAVMVGAGAIVSTWLAYKDFKKGWPAQAEVFRQIDILNQMGCKVHKVSKASFEWDAWVIREHYKIEIPATFSPEQKAKANEHWILLLTSAKDDKNMLGWPAVASAIFNMALFGLYLEVTGS